MLKSTQILDYHDSHSQVTFPAPPLPAPSLRSLLFCLCDTPCLTCVSNPCRWVMLKNVHLAPGWLVQLEKKLHSLHPHPQFRLFLTMEITPRLPVNLLRAGRVFVFEPPPGVRANLLRTFNTVRPIQGRESVVFRIRQCWKGVSSEVQTDVRCCFVSLLKGGGSGVLEISVQ